MLGNEPRKAFGVRRPLSLLFKDRMMTQWPHAPLHKISEKGIYMVTSGTYQKVHYFQAPERLNYLHETLLQLALDYGWKLQAWAVLSNHYHFIAESPEDPKTLSSFLSQLHVATAKYVNRLDESPKRRVWWQYWLGQSHYLCTLLPS
jgi:putative transposase